MAIPLDRYKGITGGGGNDGDNEKKYEDAPRDLTFRLQEVCRFVCDLDPFELFKDPNSRALIQRKLSISNNLSSSLELSFTRRDRWRSRFARCSLVFNSYLLLKGILVSALKFILLQHELSKVTQHEEHKSAVAAVAASANRWAQSILNEDFLRATIDFIGNPLAVLGDQSYYLYIGMTGLALGRLFVIPQYYHDYKHKLDMANLRFLLAPSLELKRLDALIRNRLSELERAIGHLVSNRLILRDAARRLSGQVHGDGNYSSSKRYERAFFRRRRFPSRTLARLPEHTTTALLVGGTSVRESPTSKFKEQLEEQVRALRDSRGSRGIASLRPRTFQADWLAKIRAQTRIATAPIASGSYLTALAHIALVVYLIVREIDEKRHNCPTSKLLGTTEAGEGAAQVRSDSYDHVAGANCPRCFSFTWSDLLFSLELLFCMLCCATSETAHSIIFYVNITNQVELINSVHAELDSCTQQLARDYNLLSAARTTTTSTTNQGSSTSAPVAEVDERARQRDNLLLRQLARLYVFESELVDGFRVIGQQVAQYLVHILMAASILLETSSGPAASGTFRPSLITPRARVGLLLLMALWENLIALLCCFMNTRLVQLDKRYWSILALLTRIQLCNSSTVTHCQVPGTRAYEKIVHPALLPPPPPPTAAINSLDILTDMWRKFAIATSRNIEQYCVRPIGVPLTYQRVLQLNFMGIFLYSLTLNYGGKFQLII